MRAYGLATRTGPISFFPMHSAILHMGSTDHCDIVCVMGSPVSQEIIAPIDQFDTDRADGGLGSSELQLIPQRLDSSSASRHRPSKLARYDVSVMENRLTLAFRRVGRRSLESWKNVGERRNASLTIALSAWQGSNGQFRRYKAGE